MIEKLLNKLGYMKKPKFNRHHMVKIKNYSQTYRILDISCYPLNVNYSSGSVYVYKIYDNTTIYTKREDELERVK